MMSLHSSAGCGMTCRLFDRLGDQGQGMLPGITPLEVWVAEPSHIKHSENVAKLLQKEHQAESRKCADVSSSSTPSITQSDWNSCAVPAKASLSPNSDSRPAQMVPG